MLLQLFCFCFHFRIRKLPGCIDVIALAGHVQGRQPVLGLGGNRSSSLEHHVHYILVAGAGRAVERGQPVAGLGLQIGSLVQEQGDHVSFPPFCCHVQWGDVVLKCEKKRKLKILIKKVVFNYLTDSKQLPLIHLRAANLTSSSYSLPCKLFNHSITQSTFPIKAFNSLAWLKLQIRQLTFSLSTLTRLF